MPDWRDSVAQAREGSLEAFDLVVRRFKDMAVAYAYSLLGDFHLAEDAAQEAFIQAYLDLGSLRVPQAFPSWFRQIVFKHCDRLTRRKRLPTTPLDEEQGLPAPADDPAEAAARHDVHRPLLHRRVHLRRGRRVPGPARQYGQEPPLRGAGEVEGEDGRDDGGDSQAAPAHR